MQSGSTTEALTLSRSPGELLRQELVQVEAELLRHSVSEVEVIQEAARHILGAGGKRIRPQMLILATQVAGGSVARAIPLAAAAELVHTATLVHDDIVDDSDSRRGRTAVQFRFGNSASVLMGDYLVVRAFSIAAEDGDKRLWRILTDTICRMCEGEVLQICVKGDTSISVDVYETVIECKTALLMSTCTRFGALIGCLPERQTEALADYGYHVGMAFQIADDILDFVGDEETLGKPVGGDLREGKVTLPVIYALESATPSQREELLELYRKPGPLRTEDIRRACEIIDASGGFARARSRARDYIARACECLELLPPSEARTALWILAEQIVDRDK
ncbi:MAG: polyprenyl synthetase family protein [Armatimonadetes bacterium]|nr:polyprenyl synthetase family protein [Armatimonadota bacterium]